MIDLLLKNPNKITSVVILLVILNIIFKLFEKFISKFFNTKIKQEDAQSNMLLNKFDELIKYVIDNSNNNAKEQTKAIQSMKEAIDSLYLVQGSVISAVEHETQDIKEVILNANEMSSEQFKSFVVAHTSSSFYRLLNEIYELIDRNHILEGKELVIDKIERLINTANIEFKHKICSIKHDSKKMIEFFKENKEIILILKEESKKFINDLDGEINYIALKDNFKNKIFKAKENQINLINKVF